MKKFLKLLGHSVDVLDEVEDDEEIFKSELAIEVDYNKKYIFYTSNNSCPLIIPAGKKVKN